MKRIFAAMLVFTVGLLKPSFANDLTDNLSSEEQALVDKGMTAELYKPTEHSHRFIGAMKPSGQNEAKTGDPILFYVFGMEDAAPAREEGRSMAEMRYSRAMAHEFLFAEAWDKYHDRFFTRAYVQEGEEAYEKANKK